MRLNDLRHYTQALRSLGEIQDIELPAALDLEVSAIARRCCEIGAAAPLFTRFSDHPSGFRILAATAGLSRQPGLRFARLAVSLELPATTSGLEIVEILAERLGMPAINPVRSDEASCFENVLIGDAVDLNLLPVPSRRRDDRGRCLETWGCVVSRTPDGSWTDWSIVPVLLRDAQRMAGLLAPSGHLETIARAWAEIGQPMPVAVALGVHPSIPYICGMPLPADVDKAGRVGALLGRPIETVACRTVSLDAPASAEILIEGYLHLDKPGGDCIRCPDGRAEGGHQGFACQVTAMSHRNDAILPVSVFGEPAAENHISCAISWAAVILHNLRQAGLAVTDVWLPFEAALHWIVVTVPRDWRRKSGVSDSSALARRIGELFDASAVRGITAKIILINDDVNPTDNDELICALATRFGADDDHLCSHYDRRAHRPTDVGRTRRIRSLNGTIIYDGLMPDEWGEALPIRASFRHGYPANVVEQVLSRWCDYGFGKADR